MSRGSRWNRQREEQAARDRLAARAEREGRENYDALQIDLVVATDVSSEGSVYVAMSKAENGDVQLVSMGDWIDEPVVFGGARAYGRRAAQEEWLRRMEEHQQRMARFLAEEQAKKERLDARTVVVTCACDECESQARPAASWRSGLWRHPTQHLQAPEEFSDDTPELRLWMESAANLGEQGATDLVRTVFADDA